MKKALALILTLAMLLSCVAITASAERVWSKNETVDHAWFGDAEGWMGETSPYVTGNFTYTLKLMNDGSGSGEVAAWYGTTPTINMTSGTIGFNGGANTVSYAFETNVWYTIQYVVTDGVTEVYVDGSYVGTINSEMQGIIYSGFYQVWCSELSMIAEDGRVCFFEDFEDTTHDYAVPASADTAEALVVGVEYVNENVEIATDTVTYSESNGIYGSSDPFFSGDYILTMTIKGSVAEFGKEFETVGYISGSPVINGVNDTISFVGAPSSVSYDFQDETWYKVQFVVEDETTTVKVNDEVVGEIGAYMAPMVYGTMYRCWIGECVMTDLDGNYKWGDDFEDETDDLFGGIITEVSVEGARHDLGMYYYGMNASDGHYFDPDYNLNGDETVEFDFAFDSLTATDGTGMRTDVFITGPSLSAENDTVGVNGNTVAYDFQVDTWYHIVFDMDGSNTAIYIDGAYVGTVAAVMKDLCFNGHGLAVDNLSFGDHFEDFEDQNFDEAGSCHNSVYEYDFYVAPPVDPYEQLAANGPVAEGDAKLFVTNAGDEATSYFYNPGDYPDVKSSKTVYSFDLALVPSDGNGLDEAGKTWFGIWRDTGSKRFKVGYDVNNEQLSGFAGEGDAVVGFDWGEFTATNFHDVIIIFKGTKAQIYIDGVKLYEGAAGTPGINGSGATLFEVVNGSAIVDNFAVYTPDTCELLYEGFGELSSNGNFSQAYDWTIGGDCSANRCLYGHTTRTTEPTCYSEGVDTRYCAICSETMKEVSVGMIAHKYNNYDINRVENGLIYTNCRNSGCTEKRFVTPTDEAYTGTIHAYYDMQDDFMKVVDPQDSSEPYWGTAFAYENGVATADARNYPGNYTKFGVEETIASYVDGKDWSLNFDFTYNDVWDHEQGEGYGHYLEFMLCGNNSVWLIFDVDKNTVTVTGNKFAGYNLVEESANFEFVQGATYNIQISYWQHEIIDPDDPEGWLDDDGNMQYNYVLDCALYVTINNETVIAYDYANMGYDCQSIAFSDSDSKFRSCYQQNFGVAYSIDNFVVGTHDFAWTDRCYENDVNGDFYFDSLDAVAMRQYLAKVIDGSALNHLEWDINDDGEINAKDQLALRKLLAA